MSETKQPLKGLLRKKQKEKANRRNVSFSQSTVQRATADASSSSTSSTMKTGDPSRNGNMDKSKPKSRKEYHSMNDDEDDVFDPKGEVPREGEEVEGNQRIRDAKSERALRRVAGDDAKEFDDDEKSHSSGGGRGDQFQGEEETDNRYSLAMGGKNTDQDKEQCPIEPFNMRSEREDGSGYFDGDTYVFRRHNDDDEEEDAWLKNLNEKDQNKSTNEDTFSVAASLSRKRSKPGSGSTDKSSNMNMSLTKEEVYQKMALLLAKDDETVLQALSRYGSIIKREKKQGISSAGSSSRKALDEITELCNVCMMKFDDGASIYERGKKYMSNHMLENGSNDISKRKLNTYFQDQSKSKRFKADQKPEEGRTEIGPSSKKESTKWEYRGNEDNKIHGPFTTEQMIGWIKAGYFVGEMAVDTRIISGEHPDSTVEKKDVDVDDLLDDLESDDDVTNTMDSDETWLRSDKIDFLKYL